MALAKTVFALDAINTYASGTTTLGNAADISTARPGSLLYLWYGPDSTTACTVAAEAHVQISPATSGNDSWSDLVTITFGTTTAEAEVLTGTEAAGSTVLELASTTNLARLSRILIRNSTVANSEFADIASIVTNTSITVVDGITNAQTGSTVYTQADQRIVALPYGANRVRVTYYAPTGPSACFMSKLVLVTE